jgi:hypothetical protein
MKLSVTSDTLIEIKSLARATFGSNASAELSWHVGFTPDSDVSLRGSEPTLRANKRHQEISSTRPP